jgi:hypothetical protein
MAKFKGAVKRCVVCDVSFKVPACRAETAICCSRKCKDAWWRTQRGKTLIFVCRGCGSEFADYVSHAQRRVFCSHRCRARYQDRPDFNGDKNPQWHGGKSEHVRGCVYAHATGHPFASTGNYVFEHRLVMERWLIENDPDSRFLVERDGVKYLDPRIVVHHRNEIKSDNRIENLECMTPSEHFTHHRNSPEFLEKVIKTLQASLVKLKAK